MAELKKIKQKWLRKTDDGKVVKPFFFRHLAHSKGFLNEETKAYRKHDTTMDYLMQIVDKYKAPALPKDFTPLMEIIVFKEYDTGKTNWDQMIAIMQAIKLYKEEVVSLWNFPDDPDVNKMEMQIGYMKTLIDSINSFKMNLHTIYALLKTLDSSKYKPIRSYAFNILFNIQNGAAFSLVRHCSSPIAFLEEVPDGEISIYDFKFTKKYPDKKAENKPCL